eukprot:gene50659-47040_t
MRPAIVLTDNPVPPPAGPTAPQLAQATPAHTAHPLTAAGVFAEHRRQEEEAQRIRDGERRDQQQRVAEKVQEKRKKGQPAGPSLSSLVTYAPASAE